MDEKYKSQMDQLNDKLKMYEKKINVLENNQKKNKFPDGGIVYIVRPQDSKYLKLGHTSQTPANKRFDVYNTSLPDNIEILYSINVKSPKTIERCAKSFLEEYLYRDKKEFYEISLEKMITVINNCIQMIENKTLDGVQLSRLNNKEENDDVNVYGLFIDDFQKNKIQKGGHKNSRELYINTKKIYLKLKIELI